MQRSENDSMFEAIKNDPHFRNITPMGKNPLTDKSLTESMIEPMKNEAYFKKSQNDGIA